MKHHCKHALAMLMTIVLGISLFTGLAAASGTAGPTQVDLSIGVEVSPARIDLASDAKTVVMTVKTNTAVDVAAFNFDIVCPDGWTIAAVNSTVTDFNESCYHAENRRVLWYSDTGANVNTDTLATVTFTIPADTDAGEYTVGVTDVAMGCLTSEGDVDLAPGNPSASATVVVTNSAAGYAVTLDNKTGTTPAAITGITGGSTYSGSVTFHVACNNACVVAYTTDGGETYTRLPAEANDNGGYDFTVNVTEAMEIVVALKGDANLNGAVNGADALLAQRATAGAVTQPSLQKLATDVNGNGTVNGADALLIQRFTAGATTFSW